jgi:hypothetical protein
MPTYKFYNTKTGEEYEEFMSISEREVYMESNPHLEARVNGAPALLSSRGGDRTRTPSGFKEVLNKIAEQNPYSNLASDYGAKDAKTVKVRNAVQKVKQKLGNVSE